MSRQPFDPAVTSHADVDRLLRTEPQVQLTNPPVLNNHSNDFKSHCTFPSTPLTRSLAFAANLKSSNQLETRVSLRLPLLIAEYLRRMNGVSG